MRPASTITELRETLKTRFPEAHQEKAATEDPQWLSGTAFLDAFAITRGSVNEVVCPSPSSGGALLLSGLLNANARQHQKAALIDGRDGFDPESIGTAGCRHLLWVRCHEAKEALRATDLLLRDGNLPLVILDLQLLPHRALKKIPNQSWFRLHHLAEQSGSVLIALTPCHVITNAYLQLSLPRHFPLDALDDSREHLETSLRPELIRRRFTTTHQTTDRSTPQKVG
ncbi:MAG: hypothetical protein AAF514_04665 [Verrucomicrobiota bacterium]